MATIDLRSLDDDGFVLHFGGRAHEVDALTFGNALISLTEAIKAINSEINPGYKLDISIEAVGPGSFRARLKTEKKSLRNLFSREDARNIVLALFASFIWEKLSPDQPPTIIVNTDSVVMEYRGDKIIVPVHTIEQKAQIRNNAAVNRHVAKAMEILENDPAVASVGVTKSLNDPEPLIEFPRAVFPIIRKNAIPVPEDGRRHVDNESILSVHKAVFERSSRKWEFVWNGFKISAPISDQSFFDRLESRQLSLRQGDAFRATLRVHQVFDQISGTWLNFGYEVLMVGDLVSRKPEQSEADIK